MVDICGRRFLVVGLGETGKAVSVALLARGARVRATDLKSAGELGPEVRRLREMGAELVLGGHPLGCLEGVDFVVKSPGVRGNAELLKEARRRGIPVLGELDLAYMLAPRPICAVTGTNGKGTTVYLTAHLLRSAGIRCEVAGNDTDRVLIDAMLGEPPEVLIVAEVSSYQLEGASKFKATASCVLNVKPEHADHHGSFEEYARAKRRLVELTLPDGFTVLNRDDPIVEGFSRGASCEVLWFSASGREEAKARVVGGFIEVKLEGVEGRLPLDALRLPGRHNVENALAAILLALRLGASMEAVRRGLETFKGLPHRMELVGEFGGVKFVNDSKATNPFAVVAALEAVEGPVLLLAGGRGKGADFGPMAEAARGKVRVAFVFGEAKRDLKEAFERKGVKVEVARDLADAFFKAVSMAQPGETVLLSPGCSSLDAYPNYRERGEEFRWLFRRLKEGHEGRT